MNKVQWMSKICNAKRIEKFSSIVKFCEGKNVLDVGCIGQDHSFETDGWLHGKLKVSAKLLIGADINKAAMVNLNAQGYSIFFPEELEGKDEKFDIIVMGDVIEHVKDPGSFLEYYAQFLKEDGQMIICTPNVFGIRYVFQVLFFGKPGTNDEHTVGFDPYVMLELFDRTKLVPKDFFWLSEYKRPSNWKQKIIAVFSSVLVLFRKYFNSNFMFIVVKYK